MTYHQTFLFEFYCALTRLHQTLSKVLNWALYKATTHTG